MRYFSWNEPSEIYGDIILTVSEENILKRYFPIWKEKVIRHTQIDEVEKARLLSDKVHCLEDFIGNYILNSRACLAYNSLHGQTYRQVFGAVAHD